MRYKWSNPLKVFVTALLLSTALGEVYGQEGHHEENVRRIATTEYQFQGVASGGSLIMAETSNRNARFFSIETQARESAESVVNRLAEYIDENNPFEWGGFRTGQKRITAEGGILGGLVGGYMFAGTETGLGIPEPPSSVSCSYDQSKDQILVNWTNPPGGYDYICVLMNWHNYDRAGGGRAPSQSTSFVIDRKKYKNLIDLNDLDVWVIGIRNGLPSNAGAIHVSGNGGIQEELFGIPFKNGVAPNWKAWSLSTAPDREHFACRIEKNLTVAVAKDRRYNPIQNAAAKPFKQILTVPAQGGTVGIWRKFLGLIPEHIYKVSARLSTLEMDPNDKDWSFSLHVAHNGPNRADLTVEQLGGLATLPDGSTGPATGRIVAYGPGATTNGKWVKCSTDITLPAGIGTITVWVRHSGSDSTGVGIDWIRIEDLSM